MPRSKYAKVNRLDKLHRQQKKALEQAKIESELRAVELAKEMQSLGQAGTAHTLDFHIARSKTSNLPVYEHVKDGGVKHITLIRKLSGNLVAAQQSLRAALQLPDFTIDRKGRKKDPVSINQLSNSIVIKGWRAAEVRSWAASLGF